MPQARDEAGNIWETDAAGNPVRLVQPAGGGRQATVIANPYRQREEGRKDEDQAFQREQLRLAQEAAARADQSRLDAEGRADRKEQRDTQALDARGGVDTTEAERTAAFLATRVAGGLQDLSRIGNVGAPSLKDALVGGTMLGNYTTAENRQRTINAQRDILDAALTLGTGAAYTQEQIDAYRASYFPQPGDAPATMQDKVRRLQTLMSAAKVKAGAAAPQIESALASSGISGEAKSANTPLEVNVTDDGGMTNPAADPDIAAQAQREAGGNYEDSYLAQGLSGVNQGIANTLGFPVDAANTVLNVGAQGINAIANTDLQVSDKPFLGSDYISDFMRDYGSINPETSDPSAQFVRRTGESIGGAVVPGLGGANTMRQFGGSLLGGLGGGLGAATAQQIAPGNVWAEMGGEVAGALAGGGAGLLNARKAAQREIEAGVPTVPQLKDQASALYQQAEANGITANPQQTQGLSDNIAAILAKEGTISPTNRISEVHPKIKEAYQLVNDYAGQPMKPTQMQTVRSVMADARSSPEPNESRIARLLMDEFDGFTAPLAPELSDARGIASRYLQAQTLERARELAAERAGQFTGSGFENALRTEYRGIGRNIIKGREQFIPEVEEAVRTVSRGTPTSNVARALGKYAPTGVVSAGIGSTVPFYIGSTVGGPAVGAAAAAATLGAGSAGRRVATNMGIRNADIAELLARNGGALPEANVMTPEIQRLIALGLVGQGAQLGGQE